MIDQITLILQSLTSNVDSEVVTVEIKEKGSHLLKDDCVGEVEFSIRDYADGKVHRKVDYYSNITEFFSGLSFKLAKMLVIDTTADKYPKFISKCIWFIKQ